MSALTPSTMLFHATHRVAADGVVCGANPGAQVSKRTRIWPGGLSMAGGKLPE